MGAEYISQSEFETKYPLNRYEVYTLEQLDKYRNKLSESLPDADSEFKKAIVGFHSCVVGTLHGNKIVFVKQKDGHN